MFRNREEAALRLAGAVKGLRLSHPLVLGVPHGGVVVAAVLAEALGADLDVVLARKLQASGRPGLAIGAVAENGFVYLNDLAGVFSGEVGEHLEQECNRRMQEIARCRRLFQGRWPAASASGRSVVVADDGIATGSTMIAAVQAVRAQGPRELIVAVPVLARGRVEEFRRRFGRLVFVAAPAALGTVGDFYEDFTPISDEQVVRLLREHAAVRATTAPDAPVWADPA
jgi:predicted phosphoribosyltransferase